jgi:HlyD family secretion protein
MATPLHKWLSIVAGSLVLVAVLIGLAGRDKPPLVQVTPVLRQNLISSITSNGKVEPIQPFVMRARMDAFVRKVSATEGQHVKKGQKILELDSADARARLAQARGALVAAQQQLRAAQVGGPPGDVAQLEGDIRKAQINVDRLQQLQAALQPLVATQAATKAELLANQSDLATAQSNLTALQQRRAALSDIAGSDVEKSQLAIQQQQALIQSLEEIVRAADVTAPVDGTLYSLPVHLNDYVKTGDVLAEIADLHSVRVRAFVDEPDLGWLAPGEQVLVTWDAKPGHSWSGKTEQVPQQVVARNTRSVGEVLCSMDNGSLDLVPGVNVSVRIVVRQAQNVLVVPRGAVSTASSKHWVFTLDGNHLRRREVEVGFASATRYDVLSGVSEGELVALPGDLVLADGMTVRSRQVQVPE